ncbi:MAG: SGNH/GDSL hydrolase family protein [Patescibacteria group bacterium]|nr:SGNH/GDSL hydrolase family protein [Patescibacteria group bacterium]
MKITAHSIFLCIIFLVLTVFAAFNIYNTLQFAESIKENYLTDESTSYDQISEASGEPSLYSNEELGTPNKEPVKIKTTTSSTSQPNIEDQGDEEATDQISPQTLEPKPQLETITILCLGDSITYGTPYGGSSNTYPSRLDSKLKAAFAQYDFNIINKGVGGWRADQVLGSVNSWIDTYDPDFVLLLIGGNDLKQETEPQTPEKFLQVVAQTTSEVQSIISTVKSHQNPDKSTPKLIISAFIPNTYEGVLGSAGVAYYNSQLQTNLSGYDKHFTTNWSSFYDSGTGQAKPSLMSDSFHPNTTGYSIMATNWYNQIINFL